MSLHEGDCLEVLAGLPEASVDAVVTDPPYGLSFMNSSWDRVLPDARVWAECLRVLRPGGHLAAMGATRVWHRLAVGVEDAGFEIRDSLAWLHGQGFPKSRNGEWGGSALKPAWEPVVLARKPLDGTLDASFAAHGTGGLNIDAARVPLNGDTVPEFESPGCKPVPGGSAALIAESGWSSRRTGRKRGGDAPNRYIPESQDGTGFWQGTEGRRGETKLKALTRPPKDDSGIFNTGTATFEESNEGRWPANVVHDGSEAVLAEFPSTATGIVEPHYARHGGEKSLFGIATRPGSYAHDEAGGSVARFFYTAKPAKSEKTPGLEGLRPDILSVIVEPEDTPCDTRGSAPPSADQRALFQAVMGRLESKGIEGFDGKDGFKWSIASSGSGTTDLCLKASASIIETTTLSTIASRTLSSLMRSLTSASIPGVSFEAASGGSHADDAASSTPSTTTTRALTVSIRGAAPAPWRMRLRISASVGKGPAPQHPTTKPIELMRWLVRLLSREGQVVLDPFLGSGTTAIAAVLEGRRWIGVEREPEYARIARARIDWWRREHERKPGRSVAEILGEAPRPSAKAPPEGQGALL